MSRQATSDFSQGATFRHFRRLLRYAWPHKRYLYPALGCVLIMAVTYSASIGSILPVLTVMIQEEGLHGAVNDYVVKDRLKCRLVKYEGDNDNLPTVPLKSAEIKDLPPGSALYKAGLRNDSVITEVNGQPADIYQVMQALAGLEARLQLTYFTEDGGGPRTVDIALPTLNLEQSTMEFGLRLIPSGNAPEDRWRSLYVVLLVLLVVVLVGNVARLFAEYLAVVVNTRIIIDIRRQMYAHVLRLPLARFSQNTSDTMSMFMQDMNDIFRGLNNFFQKLVTEPFKAVGVVVFAFYLDWKLTVFVMLGAPFLVFIFRKLGKRIRRANRKLLINYGQLLGRLESTLIGMRVVKAYTRENYERAKLFRIDRGILRQQLKMGFIEALMSPFMEMIGFVAAAGAILYFGSQVLFHGIQPEKFIAMLAALAAIFDPIRKLTTVYPKLQRANAAAARVFSLIDSTSEYEEDPGNTPLPPFYDKIEFDDVTFTYPNADRPAVRNLSLTVKKGEIVAIVGPNGSGKTTLLSLLPRFFSVDSGQIRIDGHDVADIRLASLRRQFSLITQESVIFPDTVRANIAYGRPDATIDEIHEVARKAFADEFIQQMPDGYDTQVGEHGATLSGGQRQRLAIARAILRNAPILIFDEATSQVDPESEKKIHQALEAFLENRTAFIIAHRYSTISDADRIAVMDEGRLEAVGTHEELFQTSPLYRRLYETQLYGNGNGNDE